MHRDEQIHLPLPLPAGVISFAQNAFARQFGCWCVLSVQGPLLLSTGEHAVATTWLSISHLDAELDLIGLGDPDQDEDEKELQWVAPEPGALLRLATTSLDLAFDP